MFSPSRVGISASRYYGICWLLIAIARPVRLASPPASLPSHPLAVLFVKKVSQTFFAAHHFVHPGKVHPLSIETACIYIGKVGVSIAFDVLCHLDLLPMPRMHSSMKDIPYLSLNSTIRAFQLLQSRLLQTPPHGGHPCGLLHALLTQREENFHLPRVISWLRIVIFAIDDAHSRHTKA